MDEQSRDGKVCGKAVWQFFMEKCQHSVFMSKFLDNVLFLLLIIKNLESNFNYFWLWITKKLNSFWPLPGMPT